MGNQPAKERLLPLARDEAGEDPNDELKGYALRAVWPALLSADDLFALITVPKRQNFIGIYKHFLWADVVPRLSPTGFPAALRWVAKHQDRGRLEAGLDRLGDEIMLHAWDHLQSSDVLGLLCGRRT